MLQKELATRLGVDKATVSNWERNLTTPAIRCGPGIIDFLGYVPLAVDGGLPQRIKTYRWLHGLTQQALAGLVGVDELAIRMWESERSRPNKRNRLWLDHLFDRGCPPGQ